VRRKRNRFAERTNGTSRCRTRFTKKSKIPMLYVALVCFCSRRWKALFESSHLSSNKSIRFFRHNSLELWQSVLSARSGRGG